MLRRLSAVGRLAGVVLLPASVVLACESPTLPLPPPEAPDVTAGPDADHVTLSSGCGGAEDDADVVVVNTNSTVPNDEVGTVALASDCGAWNAVTYAHSGDVLSVTQMFAGQTSIPVSVTVP